MGTQVLLMTEVKDVGAEGSVVTVSEGFARNYLFPRKMAAPVTEGMRRKLAKLQRERDASRVATLDAARAAAARLQGVSVTIRAKTSGEGKLYGSVGAAEIIDALKAQNIAIEREALDLEHPLKELGVFDVKIRFHPEVETAIKVWVVEE